MTAKPRPFARCALLLAAVLHLLGGGLAWGHAHGITWPGPDVVAAADDAQAFVAHAADDCAICHLQASRALAADAPAPPRAESHRHAIGAATASSLPSLRTSSALARAPPAAL